jgi:two-component system, NarL family, response regulator LiaR
MEKIKVMVADDHPAFREGFSRILEDETDLEVVALLEDGEEAVETAKKLQPDVALIDITMPKLNGIEAAKQIRDASPCTKILMISASSFPSYVMAAFRAGAAGYLLKNTPLKHLVGAIRLVHSGEGVFDLKATGRIISRLTAEKIEKNRGFEELHPRELQVLDRVAQGVGNKEIATQLFISERTVQTHLSNIFRKLRVNSRTEAVLYAIKEGWISLESLSSNNETNNCTNA